MPQKKPTRGGASGRKRASKTTKKSQSNWTRLRLVVRERLGRQTDDVWGLVLLVASAVLFLGFIGLAGPFGRLFIPGLKILFGAWAVFVPVAMTVVGMTLVFGKAGRDHAHIPIGLIVLFFGTLALFHLLTGTIALAEGVDRVTTRGGVVGSLVAYPMRRLVGLWGALIVLFTVISVGAMLTTRTTVREVALALGDVWRAVRFGLRRLVSGLRRREAPVGPSPATVVEPRPPSSDRPVKAKPKSAPAKTRPSAKAKPASPIPVTTARGAYQLPPIELLTLGTGGGQNKRSLEGTGRELEDTLRQHGVDARLTRIVPGPTVTR